jgi:hypothetical protein
LARFGEERKWLLTKWSREVKIRANKVWKPSYGAGKSKED